VIGLILAVALGLASVATVAAGTAQWAKSEGQIQTRATTLTSAKGLKIAAEEGELAVRENRHAPKSRLVEIAFVRLRGTATPPGPPLFYLEGGPGSTATGAARNPRALDFWAPLLAVGDVVLIDQRGTRDSDLTWEWDGPVPLSFFADADTARAHALAMSRRAVCVIRARGVDLDGYTTEESADDFDALRRALGTPRVSLLSFSYGTHLACSYLRRHEDAVANAILMGLEGPDQTFKLPSSADTQWRKIALLAARDSALGVPDLDALLARVEAKLARAPMAVRIPGPDGKDSVSVPIGPFGLRFIMRIDLGDATDIPVFPRLLHSIDRGDPSILAWFVRKRAAITTGVQGMSYMMDAASGATPERLARIAAESRASRWADVVNFPFPEIVPVWNPPKLAADFRGPLVTNVRTLFLSGTLDWNTPPYQAEELRWGFTNATHVIVENAGHEQTFWQNPEAMPLIVDFLSGRDVAGRRIDRPAVRFVPLEGNDPLASHPSVK
jgi:pimeloyl-ACP methyl ester carboxylesterase